MVKRGKKRLQGSESRDIFKRKHKELSSGFYGLDLDFVLISKEPPGIVAFLDYKRPYDNVTFAEALAYDEVLSKIAPIFIIESEDPENGPFVVRRFVKANWKPEPPEVEFEDVCSVNDWQGLGEFERALRKEYPNIMPPDQL